MKNDSNLFPVDTPMDSMFDKNKDGQLTGFETTMRDAALYDADKYFNESKKDYDPSPELNFSSTSSSNNQKLQTGYNILFVLVIAFIALVSPVVTIGGLILDAGYFFKEPEFIFSAFVTLVELIILIICLVSKRRRK